MNKEMIQEQAGQYEKDVQTLQQKIVQLNTVLQRTIGAREALLNLLKGEEDEIEAESPDVH